ncbi:MAG: CoA pyrophosphatase [Sphingomonas sp.]
MMLAQRLAGGLARTLAAHVIIAGDSHAAAPPDDAGLTPAAVLIAITKRAEPGVLLTQRPASMRRHAGQVAFPGGRIDPEDESAVTAALREAEEEIGLARHHVSVIGTTDRYRTGTGFDITPVIGLVPPDLPLTPNVAEVEDWFEVPLAFLLNTANHRPASAVWQGVTRDYVEIHWKNRRIWGATAGMIVNLARRMEP